MLLTESASYVSLRNYFLTLSAGSFHLIIKSDNILIKRRKLEKAIQRKSQRAPVYNVA